MRRVGFMIILVLLSFFSCKPKSSVVINKDLTTDSAKLVINKPIDKIEANTLDANKVEGGKKTQNQNLIDFAFKSFELFTSEKQGVNSAYSPVSLNIALGMVYSGARNKTAEEMSDVIGYNKHEDNFLGEFSNYLSYLNSLAKDTAIDFNLANRVFLENTYEILPEYRKVINDNFDGAFQNCDFRNNYRVEEKNINSWVSEMTKERIQKLIPEGILNETTKMVLVNAIYIKSEWKYPFDKSKTIEKNFFINSVEKSKESFMTQKQDWIKYYDRDGYQVIELPYKTKELSLLLILPKNSTSENINSLIPTGEQYLSICSGLKYEEVYMEVPKFKIESRFLLAKSLNKMGIESAFNSADFSGITEKNDLAISEVIQKIFFEMDEKGSEAAAATAVIMYQTSSVAEFQQKITYSFIANRPFIFVLKENRFDTPLFIGQFVGKND